VVLRNRKISGESACVAGYRAGCKGGKISSQCILLQCCCIPSDELTFWAHSAISRSKSALSKMET